MLCENPWNGGGGYTPEQVGQMTLDQIWFRLCDIETLRGKSGRSQELDSLTAIHKLKADKDGLYRGRAKDGAAIKGRIGEKSKARQLIEEAEERRKKEGKKTRRKKRRERKRGG